jgi:hypothetical protein
MRPACGTDLRDAIRRQLSQPIQEIVVEIAHNNHHPATCNWHSQWQKQGQMVQATTKPPEQWSAADKQEAVILAAGLSTTQLGAFYLERGVQPISSVCFWSSAQLYLSADKVEEGDLTILIIINDDRHHQPRSVVASYAA